MGHLLAFLGVSMLVIATPGPDTTLTMRNALLWGRRAGVFTGFGVVTGLAIWAFTAAAGLAALLRASEPAFVAIKIAGAAYLVYLGARALWGALRHGTGLNTSFTVPGTVKEARLRVVYRQGLLSDLGNPKIAVFFGSLLPQFAPGGRASFPALLALGLLFCVLTLAFLLAYSFAVAKAGDVLRRPAVRRRLDGVTGAVLIGLGIRLAAEDR